MPGILQDVGTSIKTRDTDMIKIQILNHRTKLCGVLRRGFLRFSLLFFSSETFCLKSLTFHFLMSTFKVIMDDGSGSVNDVVPCFRAILKFY